MLTCLALAAALALQPQSPVVVVFETTLGKIELAVDASHAPVTAANFLRYVDAGAYDRAVFHRTVRPGTESRTDFPIEVVQATIREGFESYPEIALERTRDTGLHHLAGTVSMARGSPPNSASTDIFICITDSPSLDFGGRRNPDGQGFAAFARVVSGMDVVRKINAAPTALGADGRPTQSLTPPIVILKAYRKPQ